MRRSPFFNASLRYGCWGYTVYNHMFLPIGYGDLETEYWKLLNDVTLWDAGVEISAPPERVYGIIADCSPKLQTVPTPETRSVWDGVYTEEQARRGETLDGQECSSCHGEDLMGVDEASPLAGVLFISNWDGLTVGDLFAEARCGSMPRRPLEREVRGD